MKNVTISMDEETLGWARVQAAQAGLSLSRWLGGRLERDRLGYVQDDREDEDALEALLAMPPMSYAPTDKHWSREEIYDEALERHTVVCGYQRAGLFTRSTLSGKTDPRRG